MQQKGNDMEEKTQNNQKLMKYLVDILIDIAGGLLLTVAIYCFAIPADFPMTGVSGVALILYHLFHTPVGMVTILLNIPIAIACYKPLGRQFYLNSLRTTVVTSLIMDAVGPRLPVFQGDMILAAVSGGVLCGIGYGIIFMRNSSTGGFDFITMALKAKWPHISLGKIAFVTDSIVIVAGGCLIGNVTAIIYGLILNYLYSAVLDRVVYGTNYGKLTMIITDHPKEVAAAIDQEAGRGSTIIHASGSYSGEKKEVVLCACNNKEMYVIKKRAHEIDEKAFVIILESNEVIGEGFRLPGETSL